MMGQIEIVAGDIASPQATALLDVVWPPQVVAALPWKDVVWAHPDWRVLVYNPAKELIGHVEIFLRDATWDTRTVKLGGIGAVATRPDCRRQGVATTALRRAAGEMQDTHGVDFALLFCEDRHASVYEKLGWRKFEGDVFTMQPHGRVRFDVTEALVLDANLAPRKGVIDLCGLPW
jgi:aminoglycoside 2'-N-acetyltransferase I